MLILWDHQKSALQQMIAYTFIGDRVKYERIKFILAELKLMNLWLLQLSMIMRLDQIRTEFCLK
jgi:hypothetical protein